jgi:hypothetical protein
LELKPEKVGAKEAEGAKVVKEGLKAKPKDTAKQKKASKPKYEVGEKVAVKTQIGKRKWVQSEGKILTFKPTDSGTHYYEVEISNARLPGITTTERLNAKDIQKWKKEVEGAKVVKPRELNPLKPLQSELGQLSIDFDALYKNTIGKIIERRKQKGRVSKTDIDNFVKGEITKYRTVNKKKGIKAPPIYAAEEAALRNNITEIKPGPLQNWTQNPPRVFEEAGSEAKQLFYDQMIDAYDRLGRARKDYKNDIRKKRKGISIKNRRRVGLYAISQQEGGMKRLTSMGIKSKNVPKWEDLNPVEQDLYKWGRRVFDWFHENVNAARAKSGKEPMNYTGNYTTFMRDLNLLEREGFNPMAYTKMDKITAQFVKLKATPFRFAKARAKFQQHTIRFLADIGGIRRKRFKAYPFITHDCQAQGVHADFRIGKSR